MLFELTALCEFEIIDAIIVAVQGSDTTVIN